MATRKTPKTKTQPDPHALRVPAQEGATEAEQLAVLAASGVTPLAMMAHAYSGKLLGDTDITAMAKELTAQTRAVHGGDLRHAETLLIAQATTLNTVFVELLRRSGINMGEHLGAAETYMRLALKAQGQCRATLETLATIKNPPVVFAKQANITSGPQQVNNGVLTPAGKTQSPHTELLEDTNHVGMDTRATPAPARSNPALETVGAIHRPDKPRGKGGGSA